MKDSADKRTGDLVQGLDRRVKHAEAKKRDGWQRRAWWIHRADWEAGREAAQLGSTTASDCPPGRDRMSWTIGYAEWLAECDKARAAKEAAR